MANNIASSYTYTLVFDGDVSPAKSKLKNIFKDAQEMAREDGKLEFKLTTDKKGIENLIKQVSDINPELAASIRLNYNSKDVREFQGVLQNLIKSGTKDTKLITGELTKFIKSGMNKVDKISLNDFFDLHGGTGSKSKNHIADVINNEINNLLNFDFNNSNLSDINGYIERIRQLYSVIDEYSAKYKDTKSFGGSISKIYENLSQTILNNNSLDSTIEKIINDDVDKLKNLIARLGVVTDEEKISGAIGDQTINLIPKIETKQIQEELNKHEFEVKIKPVLDFKNGKLQDTIKEITNADSMMKSNGASRKERGFYYNSKSNFVGNSHVFDKKDEINAALINAMYKYTQEQADEIGETIDAFYHSHPREYSAFSASDLKRLLVERQKHNVNKFLNSSLKEVSQFDSSGLSDDQLSEIIRLFEERIKTIETNGMKKKKVLVGIIDNATKRITGLDQGIYTSLYDILYKYIDEKLTDEELMDSNTKKADDIISDIQDTIFDKVESTYNDDETLYGESFVENIIKIFSLEASKMLHKLEDVNIPDDEIRSVLDEGREELQYSLTRDIDAFLKSAGKANVTNENEADKIYQKMLIDSIKDVFGYDFDVEKILKTIPVEEFTKTQTGFNIPVNLEPNIDSIPRFIELLKEELSGYDIPVNVTPNVNKENIDRNTHTDKSSTYEQSVQDAYDNGEPIKYKVEPDINETEVEHQLGIIQNIFDETDTSVFYNVAPNLKNNRVNDFVNQIQNAIDEQNLNVNVNINPVVDENKFGGNGNNLKKTIKDIVDSEDIIAGTESNERKRRERAFFFNRDSDFVGNAYTYADETSVSRQLYDAIYEYTQNQAKQLKEQITGFFHSHPENLASFSFADIQSLAYDKKHNGVTKYVVAALKEVAEFDAKDLEQSQIDAIANEYEKLRNQARGNAKVKRESLEKFVDKYNTKELSDADQWQLVIRDKLHQAIKNVMGQDYDIEKVLKTIPIEEYTKTQTGFNIQFAVTPDLNSIPEFLKILQMELEKYDPVKIKATADIDGIEIKPTENGSSEKVPYNIKARIDNIESDLLSIQQEYNDAEPILYPISPNTNSIYTHGLSEIQRAYDSLDDVVQYLVEASLLYMENDFKKIQLAYDNGCVITYDVVPNYYDVGYHLDEIKRVINNNINDTDEPTILTSGLASALDKIIEKAQEKNQAFIQEEQIVSGTTQHEITDLQELIGWIEEVNDSVVNLQNSISSGDNNGIQNIVNELSKLGSVNFDNLSKLSDFKKIAFTDGFATKFAKNIDTIVTSIDKLVQTLKTNASEATEFISDIKDMLAKSKELSDLATIISESKAKIQEATIAATTVKQENELKEQQEKIRLIEEEKKKREELYETVNKINQGIIDHTFTDEFDKLENGFKEFNAYTDDTRKKLSDLSTIINVLFDSSKSMEERAAALAQYTESVKLLNAELKQANANFKIDKNGVKTVKEARGYLLGEDASLNKYTPEASGIKYKEYLETYDKWLQVSEKISEKIYELSNSTGDEFEKNRIELQDLTKTARECQKQLDQMLSGYGGEKQTKIINDTIDKVDKLKDVFDGAYSSDWEKLNSALVQNNKELEKGTISITEYKKRMESAIGTFNSATKSGGGALIGSAEDAEKAFAQVEEHLRRMGVTIKKDLSGKMEANTDGVYKWTAAIMQADGQVQELGFTFNSASNQIRVSTKNVNKELVGLPKVFNALKQQWLDLSKYWTSRAFDIQSITQYFRQGIQIIQQYDDALVEMRKVSNDTEEALRSFASSSFDIANRVGTTGLQMQQSAADFMRLGESIADASKHAQEANILFNVSEFQGIDEATESFIAMTQAYKELDSLDVVNKLNVVGNNFAISTSGLSTALQKSAAALKTAGEFIARIYGNIYIRTHLTALKA